MQNQTTLPNELPNIANKRLSDFSYNGEEFQKARPLHENASESSFKPNIVS